MANEMYENVSGNIVRKITAGSENDVITVKGDGTHEFTPLPIRFYLERWSPQEVKKGTLAVDSGWTMLSKIDTEEQPAPQPLGNPVFGYSDTDVFATSSNNSVIFSGHQYIFQKGGWVERIRVQVPELTANTNYRFIIADITAGQVNTIEEPILVTDEWVDIAIGTRIVAPGTTWICYIDALNSSSTTNISGGWRYDGSSQNSGPSTSGWNRNNQNSIIRIDKTDLDTVDRSSELGGVTPDSDIVFVQTNDTTRFRSYRVTDAPINQGTYYEYSVQSTGVGPGGEPINGQACTVDIDIPIPQPTSYFTLTGKWSVSPDWADITGFLQYGNSPVNGQEFNGFGIDLRFQEASISNDWAFVAHSGEIGNLDAGTTNEIVQAFSNAQNQAGANSIEIPEGDDLFLFWDSSNNYAIKVGRYDDIVNSLSIQTTSVLQAFSAASTQEPPGLDTAIQIEFGPAQGTGGDPVMIDANGTITFNEEGFYQIYAVAQFGRQGVAGESDLRFRKLYNGVQTGITLSYAIDRDKFIADTVDSFVGYFTQGETIEYELYRDSMGNNSGGLFSQPVNLAGWNPSPTASVQIQKIEIT